MKTYLISIFLLLSLSCFGQNAMTKADKETYDLLMNKDYKKMIEVGKAALKEGIDFYYLQLRMGIAYYELQNYEMAIPYFVRAKNRNAADELNLEYLYFSYLFSNRLDDAHLLASHFSETLKTKIGYKPHFIEKISVDAGTLFTQNYNKYRDYDFLGTENKGMKGTFYSNVYFGNLLIDSRISPKINIKNSISYYSNTANDIFQTKNLFNQTINNQIFSNVNHLFQYNLVGSVYLKKGWTLYAGGGIYYSQYVLNTMQPPSNPPKPIISTDKKVTQYSASLSISKKWKYIEPTVSINVGKLSDSTQTASASAGLSYYPLGNTHLYGNTTLASIKTDSMTNFVLSQTIGIKTYKSLWLEVNGSIGNHINYISANGLYVYNTPEPILWNTGIGLNYYAKRMEFSVKYGLQQRGGHYDYATLNGSLRHENYQYLYQMLSAKVAWRF